MENDLGRVLREGTPEEIIQLLSSPISFPKLVLEDTLEMASVVSAFLLIMSPDYLEG